MGPQWMPPPPPPPASNSTGLVVGMSFAGLGAYSIVNLVLGFVIFIAAMDQSTGGGTGLVAAGAVILVLVGLGAGVGLLLVRKPWATGLGLGLMIGWALWSITTAGFCTGLNPSLYG
ncbi:hypothetical protein [Nonomuraea sp. LPB2021202275-12-8]|uniref:hypothetical protein n=1 Tax=Nonomuraea sp. LPB2021202275-12-8 TaxID=3120159 RepID=UPI00300CB1E3